MFFNTVNVRGQQLRHYQIQTDRQEDALLEFFAFNSEAEITPEDVWLYHPLLRACPITSVRRAFTNLKTQGLIEKTDNQVEGMYGMPIYTWKFVSKQAQQRPLL